MEGETTLATSTTLIRDIIDPARGTRWTEFDRIYRPIVFGIARKAGLNFHDAEDVTQDVFRDLSRNLAGFEIRERRGSFRRYLFNLVRWRLNSKFDEKTVEAARTVELLDPEMEANPLESLAAEPLIPHDAEAEFTEAVNQAMLVLARELSPKHVQLLELYFCQEWPAKRVAEALGICTATVFTIAHRHKLRLLREILRRL